MFWLGIISSIVLFVASVCGIIAERKDAKKTQVTHNSKKWLFAKQYKMW